MSKTAIPFITRAPLPKGTDEYEQKCSEIVASIHASIPEAYLLDQATLTNPPLDVTSIPGTCGILTPEELEITEKHDAISLIKAIVAKKYSAVAVAKAFCKRAAIAHQLTCCLTEYFEEEALERAKYLDDYLAQHGKPIGPLHGLPISVKAHMPIAGHWADWGFLATRTKTDYDCYFVDILRNAGAVFYVKTNQPQAIMHLESDGFHGRTLNPWNLNLSAGGSSGGEGALNALRGSVLGLGSDIGGSIRGPSGFCNIHGFKPTSYMLTTEGFLPYPGFPAELNVLATGGPMCRSLRDADLLTHVLRAANQHLRDPRVIPMPWTGLSTKLPPGPIKLGIMLTDGAITPHPPVLRALAWAKQTIGTSPLAAKFELKPFTPHASGTANKLIHEYYWPDGRTHVNEALAATGEPMHPLTTWGLRNASPDKEIPASAVMAQRVVRDTFRAEFVKAWNAQDVDYVLAPVFVGTASEHDTAKYWNYTALWNFVDYPGIVIPSPIRAKAKGADQYPEGWTALSEDDAEVRKMWEAGDFEGAPVALQLIARKYHDNDLMAVAGQVEEALGYRPFEDPPQLDW